jgi:hypothetical protein
MSSMLHCCSSDLKRRFDCPESCPAARRWGRDGRIRRGIYRQG